MLLVSLGRCGRAEGWAASGQPRWDSYRRRFGTGGRARESGRQSADPGNQLRRLRDAAEGEAAGRDDRQFRAMGRDGNARPARRYGTRRKIIDQYRGRAEILVVSTASRS